MNASQSYREADVRGASPVRLVILLYEQAIVDLQRALAAHREGDIEARTREINHAILVMGHLEATLDKEQGGPVAAALERFYQQVRAGLVDAQLKQSASLLEQQIAHLMEVRAAWSTVERSLLPEPAPPKEQSGNQSRSEWNA